MDVDPKAAAGKAEHGGRTFHFCSASCQQRFKADPAKYAKAA